MGCHPSLEEHVTGLRSGMGLRFINKVPKFKKQKSTRYTTYEINFTGIVKEHIQIKVLDGVLVVVGIKFNNTAPVTEKRLSRKLLSASGSIMAGRHARREETATKYILNLRLDDGGDIRKVRSLLLRNGLLMVIVPFNKRRFLSWCPNHQ